MEGSEPKLDNYNIIWYGVNSLRHEASIYKLTSSQHGSSDNVAIFSALSNPADTNNVSCLELCGRDICPKSYA